MVEVENFLVGKVEQDVCRWGGGRKSGKKGEEVGTDSLNSRKQEEVGVAVRMATLRRTPAQATSRKECTRWRVEGTT